MDKIEFLVQQKERSRELFMKTGDRSHLEDMNYFERRIRKEERKPAERMERALVILMFVVVAAPFVQYLWRVWNGV